jgi:hypothetical protein
MHRSHLTGAFFIAWVLLGHLRSLAWVFSLLLIACLL